MTGFIFFAVAGYALMAVVAVLDKFIVSKSLSANTYAFYSTFFFFGAFLLLPFSESISQRGFFLSLISALGFGFGTWLMMLCLSYRKATHVIPFIGASAAVSTFVLSSIFLGESLTLHQMIGIGFLVLACLGFSYEREDHKEGGRRGTYQVLMWGVLSGLYFGISHIAAKEMYLDYSFITGLVWTKGLVVVVALMILALPSVRKEILGKRKPGKASSLSLVLIDKILALLGTVSIQYAFAIGSVAVVSGLVGIQYALTLIIVIVFTALAPKVFHEYFTKKEIAIEIAAIILTMIGVYLLI